MQLSTRKQTPVEVAQILKVNVKVNFDGGFWLIRAMETRAEHMQVSGLTAPYVVAHQSLSCSTMQPLWS